MTIYVHAVGYTFGLAVFFLAGIAVGISHERHRLSRRMIRRARRT